MKKLKDIGVTQQYLEENFIELNVHTEKRKEIIIRSSFTLKQRNPDFYLLAASDSRQQSHILTLHTSRYFFICQTELNSF